MGAAPRVIALPLLAIKPDEEQQPPARSQSSAVATSPYSAPSERLPLSSGEDRPFTVSIGRRNPRPPHIITVSGTLE